jgi:pimeloyl-ACP methyl ester carboxylesterase
VVPPFGKTMRDMFVPAMFLTGNGFSTCRFDYVDHVGASDGEILDFTLSSALEDLEAVIGAVRRRAGRASVGLLSFSLGSRVAFRALRRRRDVACVVSLVGVVNVRETLRRILGRDLVGDQLRDGFVAGDYDVLDYLVNGGRFFGDAVRAGWHSLDSTREDLAACAAPVVHISADDDAWVDMGEIEGVAATRGAPHGDVLVVRGASHRLEANPSATRVMLATAVRSFSEHLRGERASAEEVRIPAFRALVERNRLERRLEQDGYRRSGSDRVTAERSGRPAANAARAAGHAEGE